MIKRRIAILIFVICIFITTSATTFHVAPNGNDKGTGTINFPFRTINRAAEVAQTGDIVLVAEGIYRERVIPLRSGVTYQAEPGWKVYIKGSALWNPSWKPEGSGIYSASPDDSLFNDVPSDFIDSHNPFQTPLCFSPNNILGAKETGGDKTLNFTLGQVFVNGEMYMEMGKKSLLTSEKQWWYDRDANRIYVMFGTITPGEQEVEITVRRRILAPLLETGVDNITLEGFIFEHCGNQYPDRFQKSGFEQNMISGAVGIRNNNGWIIRNCMIRYAKTIGIDAIAVCNNCNGPTNILIERCYIVSNGQTGIFCRRTANSVYRDNVIMYNNVLGFGKTKPHAKSTAGFKGLGGFSNNTIERNYFANNHSHGLWFDLNANNNTITGNVFVDNEEDAFFVELGGQGFDKNFFTSNLVLGGNHQNSSLRYVDCGGMTYLHNLIIDHPSGTGENVAGFFSKTFNADRKDDGYTYTVGDFTFFNNLWIGVDVPIAHPYPDHYASPSKFNYNVYSGTDSSRIFGIHRQCGSPFPYTIEQVAELVHQDLGNTSPGISAMIIGDLVRLTATEWEKFWQVNGTTGDTNSFISKNSTALYNRSTQTLSLDLDFDPAQVGSENHTHSGEDFLGVPIPQNGKALPGPFQNLKSGKNTYKVWPGISILEEGQVPSNSVTSAYNDIKNDLNNQIESFITQKQSELIITLKLKQQEQLNVRVYDLTGRTVDELLNNMVGKGTHRLLWDKKNTPHGCYILSVQSKTLRHGQLFIIQ